MHFTFFNSFIISINMVCSYFATIIKKSNDENKNERKSEINENININNEKDHLRSAINDTK